jgi:hypothetical protein
MKRAGVKLRSSLNMTEFPKFHTVKSKSRMSVPRGPKTYMKEKFP